MSDKKKFDRSDLISFMALLLSLGAIFVSVKQTSILRDQQKTMASQQEGSVWPHLDCNASIVKDLETITFSFYIHNQGIGPAIIKDFDFNSPKGPIDTMDDFIVQAKFYIEFENSISQQFDHPVNEIISPGERKICIKLVIENNPENAEKICYESIYKKKYGNDC